MRLFGKNREVIEVKKIRGVRAKYIGPDENRINLELVTTDGEKLELHVPTDQVPRLVRDLTVAHEAIHPTIRGGGRAATWQGMED